MRTLLLAHRQDAAAAEQSAPTTIRGASRSRAEVESRASLLARCLPPLSPWLLPERGAFDAEQPCLGYVFNSERPCLE